MLKQKLFTRFDCFVDDPEAPEPEFEVVSVDITEALSTPYEIKVKLSSPLVDLSPRYFIRRPGRVILHFGHHKRYFHGFIGVFKQLQLFTNVEGDTVCFYEACLYPHLWFLKFNKDYRIFQEQSTLDIVTRLLEENKMVHIDYPKMHSTTALEHADPIRKYCVQYGESDFDFISRLLEDRSFYYYFEHHASKHHLKLAFTHHDHKYCPVIDGVEIRETDFKGNELNKILTYEIASKMLPQHHVLMDYNYHFASAEMFSHVPSAGTGGAVYDYPGGFNNPHDAHIKTRNLVEKDESEIFILSGKSTAPFFSPGFKFNLLGHPNLMFDEKVFTLEVVTHHIIDPRFSGEDDLLYYNTFTAFLSNALYRPEKKTQKPRIYGTQTAMVVAPHGEEVWTDEQGRVKVQFHWNHRGYKMPLIINEHSRNHHTHHHSNHHRLDREHLREERHHHKRHRHKHRHAHESHEAEEEPILIPEEE